MTHPPEQMKPMKNRVSPFRPDRARGSMAVPLATIRSDAGFQTLLLLAVLFIGLPLPALAQVDLCGLNWRRVNTANSPGHLIGQAAAYDSGRGVAVLFGGNNPFTSTDFSSDTWELTGTSWSKANPPLRPHRRRGSALAYDSARGVCVLFGGGTNIFGHEIPFNDTWEWDGTVWTERRSNNPSAGDGPPPLDFPLMTYDSHRKRAVLIAGSERRGNKVDPADRTWEWDGQVWTAHLSKPAPVPRSGTAMVYDSARRVVLLFGGRGGRPLGDTWTWDGVAWKLVTTGGTVAREDHAMAFDERRKVVVLFSGATDLGSVSPTAIAETSEWDGSSWTPLGITPQFGVDLQPRRLHLMWYDTHEQRVMIFGGLFSASFTHTVLEDLWEARPPGQWVDFSYGGAPSLPETGEFHAPFNTLTEAVIAAPPGCTVILKPGALSGAITVTKPLTLEAYAGPVTLGRN